jgi:Zn finger protein HypA/HybF involved in hydrogenase expression
LFGQQTQISRCAAPAVLNATGKGTLEKGFARVRCDNCQHEYLLAFSCKGRWFCPSCHQKKVQLFGALLTETILFPVPHRHCTFGIPKKAG